MLGILSAEEMNVSITTCAPLKKSPNYTKGEGQKPKVPSVYHPTCASQIGRIVGRSQLTPYSNYPHDVSATPTSSIRTNGTHSHDSELTQRTIRELQLRIALQLNVQGYDDGLVQLVHKHRMPSRS